MVNVKQFEYGIIAVLLANAELRDVAGTLTDTLDADSNIQSFKLTLSQPPLSNKSGVWLTGNAGNGQRFEYKNVVDNTDGTYTFSLEKLTTVKVEILAGTDAYVEKSKLPIVPYGDIVESDDFTYIQVKADRNQQEFPGMKGDAGKLWNITAMIAVVNRIAQDKDRTLLTAIYALVERTLLIEMTTIFLTTDSGVTIHGFLQAASEDGRWDNERQGMVTELEIKYNND